MDLKGAGTKEGTYEESAVNIITLSWVGLGSVVRDVECSSCRA